MIWDPAVLAHQWQAERWADALQRRSRRWRIALDAPGLKVLSLVQRGDAPIAASWMNGAGLVVGPLFARGRERAGRVCAIDTPIAERIAASVGAHLIKEFWGNYVAFWRDPPRNRTHVLRDPCGAAPCFMTKAQGVDLFFSHAEDVCDLAYVRFTIDWTYLQSFILFNYFVTPHTGLNEIIELMPGQRLDWKPRGPPQLAWAWNGTEIAAAANALPFADAAGALRETAEACFSAWGREYGAILMSLSGGLDSSVMANLMARVSDARLVGVHFLGVGHEGFETALARKAAQHAGVELIEIVQDPAQDEVRRILDAPRTPRPKVQSLAVLIDDVSTQLADEIGAEAFMIGQGGDNLFLQRGGATHILTDYVRLNGFGRDGARVAYDAATLQQKPLLSVLADAVAAIVGPTWRPYAFLDAPAWTALRPLAPGAAETIPHHYKLHPWLTDARRLPPGKADHLLGVVGLYNYYLHHGRGLTRDVSYPYFSQPLTEFALKTPTYVLGRGGLDRALARRAFADLIPEEIARRTGKGGADAYQLRVTQANLGFYRDLILNGVLVQKNWLDRAKIERMLSPAYATHGGGALFLYLIVAAEAWAHTWRAGAAPPRNHSHAVRAAPAA